MLLSADQLGLAVSYLLQRFADARAEVELPGNVLRLRVSLALPLHLPRRYINLDARFVIEDDRPRIDRISAGSVPLPAALAIRASEHLLRRFDHEGTLLTVLASIESIELAPGEALLRVASYPAQSHPEPGSSASARQAALSHYLDQLAELQSRGIGVTGRLIDVLQPLFQSAQVRSREYDPISENKALLTVLGTWANRRPTTLLVQGSVVNLQPFRLSLNRRRDSARHFTISAALSARGDRSVSDALGLYKELVDGDRGSGFSFPDMVANRAGSRFGELATQSRQGALAMQRRLAAGPPDDNVMPSRDDLPPSMSSAEFDRRFGHVGSPAYLAVIAEIEARIDAKPFYTLPHGEPLSGQ